MDGDLTQRLSQDLDVVFAEVVSDHEGAVYSTALRVSGRPDEAEDLAAETFLRAYAALRRYSPERIHELKLRPWLITICLNLWRNQIRAASRRPMVTRPGLSSSSSETSETEAASPWESPEASAERREDGSNLAALLLRLADKQRIAVVLRHVVGLSYLEVAEVLGCPESTAKSHVRRGLEQLRALVTPPTPPTPERIEPEVLHA